MWHRDKNKTAVPTRTTQQAKKANKKMMMIFFGPFTRRWGSPCDPIDGWKLDLLFFLSNTIITKRMVRQFKKLFCSTPLQLGRPTTGRVFFSSSWPRAHALTHLPTKWNPTIQLANPTTNSGSEHGMVCRRRPNNIMVAGGGPRTTTTAAAQAVRGRHTY